MQTDKRCLATPRNAKDYLARNEIPQLFECLMTGLIYHRPISHIEYLQQCLDKIKKQGVSGVRWDMFLEARSIPLPPISPICKEEFTAEGAVETDTLQLNISYDAALVICIAGPGIGKNDLIKHACKNYPRFHMVSMGNLLRERAQTEINKGIAKWKVASSLINSGELAPDDMALQTLIRELNYNVDVSGYIIEGYPRNRKQIDDFEKHIGMNRLNFVILIDCEEDTCQHSLIERAPIPEWTDNSSSAIGRRIANYKAYTLPVCKFFDDQQKLKMVDGDKTKEEVLRDISKIFKIELADFENEATVAVKREKDKFDYLPQPGSIQIEEIPELFNVIDEIIRPKELPQCPIVLLLGGPGSGKTGVALELCNRYQDWVLINANDVIRERIFDKGVHTQNWDCLAKLSTLNDVNNQQDQLIVEHWNINPNFIMEEMKNLKNSTKGIIIEGFPNDEVQLNELNIKIGRTDLVILLDCDEYFMTTRLLERNERLHRPDDDLSNIKSRIQYYKTNGLTVCRYYDEKNRLNIIPGDRKFEEVFIDIVSLFETAIMKNRCVEIKTEAV